MKRFRFPLDALLALRRRKLEKFDAELAALEQRKAASLRRAAELERRSAETRASVQVAARIRGSDLRRIDASAQAMLQQAAESRQAANNLERELAKARQALLHARREVETLDNLRERGLQEWRRAADREDEALAAELYLARHNRR